MVNKLLFKVISVISHRNKKALIASSVNFGKTRPLQALLLMLPELGFVICHMWIRKSLRTGQHQSGLVYDFSLSSFREGH